MEYKIIVVQRNLSDDHSEVWKEYYITLVADQMVEVRQHDVTASAASLVDWLIVGFSDALVPSSELGEARTP